jgi:nitroreductase
MKSLIQQIKERRSIRQFKEKEIDEKNIEEIINIGKFAPSADNRQPWRFIVVTNKETINELSCIIKEELKKLMKKKLKIRKILKELQDENIIKLLYGVSHSSEDLIFFNAPCLIFIICEDKLFNIESCACCAQNMMLGAHVLGIGSCWIGFASVLGLKDDIMLKLGMPEGYKIAATLVFGYPDEKIKKPLYRKVGSDIINWKK